MSPKAAPDYPGIVGAARRIAQAEAVQKAERVLAEKCWTKGCDQPRSDERDGYWCTRHHDERRERIMRAMSKLKNDSMGMPRQRPDTHEIEIREGFNHLTYRDEWWWVCSCGKASGAASKSKGIAAAGGARHLRSTPKAETKA